MGRCTRHPGPRTGHSADDGVTKYSSYLCIRQACKPFCATQLGAPRQKWTLSLAVGPVAAFKRAA
eukprot:349637-Chlamydomonas_euryale.AAC.2